MLPQDAMLLVFGGRGRWWRGEGRYSELLSERALGAEHPDTLTVRANLADWTGDAGDAAAARDQLAALLPTFERVLGPEHRQTLAVRGYLTSRSRQAES